MKKWYSPRWYEELARRFYTLLLILLLPVFWLKFRKWGSNQTGAFQSSFVQRLGFVPGYQKQGYLFHCVSVGEVMVASCVIKSIQQSQPDVPVTITTTTETGSARVKSLFGSSVQHFYLPLDLPCAMRRMLARLQPAMVIITEVELWPNLIHSCWQKDIPVTVINARMTERSAARYAKISALFKPMLFKLSHVCAQGKRDFQQYLHLGIPPEKLTLTNNIKFDQVSSSNNKDVDYLALAQCDRPVIVAGSTHDPEETILLDAFSSVTETHPEALLVIVPRHPQRFELIKHLLADSAFTFSLSSQTEQVATDSQVLLVDEMGKLNEVYQLANIAFVGGSIADRGGHNALEPAAAAIPILMGPHRYNNPEICEYLEQEGALHLVSNAQDITHYCNHWLTHPDDATKAGEAGREVLTQNQGAVEATVSCLLAAQQKSVFKSSAT